MLTPFFPRLTNELIESDGELRGEVAFRSLAEGTRPAHDEIYEIALPACRSRL
jgi:hypothetical protein